MTIYALFVAISEYPKGISDLPGCLNDVGAMEDFMREYAARNSVKTNFNRLVNTDATRAGVIEGFSHFEAAGPEDICLLYYTGHGAQMMAPKEFQHLEVKRRLQTMVLHDSRLPGGKDLADKEISFLIAKHTANAGQVLVIADSCNSGSISRLSVGIPRTVPENGAAMRIEDFHGHQEYSRSGEHYTPPVRAHLTLSACRPEQVAMEMPIKGVRHGLFTHYLIEVMSSMDLANCSYAELMARVRVRVKNHYRGQDVYTQASGAASMDQRFFNGALKMSRDFVLHHDEKDGWFINEGAMAGVEPEAKVVVLDGAEERELTVRRTDAGRSYLAPLPFLAPASAPYPLVSVDKKMEPLAIYVDDELPTLARASIVTLMEDEKESLRLTEDPAEAKYHVVRLPDYGISMVLPGEKRPLFESVPKPIDGWSVGFVDKLAKVSAYESTLNLGPKANILDVDQAVDITLEQVIPNEYGEIIESETKALDGTAVFSYTKVGDQLLPALLRLRVKVKTNQVKPLFVGMLLLDEAFGVSGKFLPVIKLEAGDEPTTTRTEPDESNDGSPPVEFIVLEISKELQSWGVTDITNFLKVIVSETEFSLNKWEQVSLSQQVKLTDQSKNTRAAGSLGGLFKRRPDRWGVKDIPFTIFRPLFAGGVKTYGGKDADAPVTVATAPEGFSFGEMMLDSSLSTTRAMTGAGRPLCPVRNGILEPMALMGSRSALADDTPLDMIQLFNVSKAEAVTEKSPLELNTDMAAAGALVFGYDEESGRYYPVGFPDKDRGVMVLHQLPDAQPEEYTRSLGGSIKLFFRQVIRDYLPWPLGEINKLRVSRVKEDMTTEYLTDDPEKVKKAVRETDGPIALFVHGIIGDTTTAPAILERARFQDGSTLGSRYSLLLTYDYENLKTPIGKTAEKLQSQLKDAGLGENHGKTLHAYAHSMGGLVCRSFIEMLHGRQVVSHLIQFGTPNGGSPYGNAAQWMTPLLSRALEGGAASAAAPLLPAILGLRWFVNTALATLKEMRIGSEFLKRLAKDGDRGDVRYTMINGDIRLLPDVDEQTMGFFRRIVARLDYQEVLDATFFQAPTDIAVSVKSQREVPGLDVPEDPVPSDHMSYFVTPAAIERLEGYLGDIFPEESPS